MAAAPSSIESQLLRDEGLRLKPYRDTVGKLTIGVGRNLDDVGISTDEAMLLLDNDIKTALGKLVVVLPWVNLLDPVRQAVLINMAFNMGVAALLEFKQFLTLMQAGSYTKAAADLESTEWHQQVPARATRLEKQLTTGEWQ